jgi:hypothetical protein
VLSLLILTHPGHKFAAKNAKCVIFSALRSFRLGGRAVRVQQLAHVLPDGVFQSIAQEGGGICS